MSLGHTLERFSPLALVLYPNTCSAATSRALSFLPFDPRAASVGLPPPHIRHCSLRITYLYLYSGSLFLSRMLAKRSAEHILHVSSAQNHFPNYQPKTLHSVSIAASAPPPCTSPQPLFCPTPSGGPRRHAGRESNAYQNCLSSTSGSRWPSVVAPVHTVCWLLHCWRARTSASHGALSPRVLDWHCDGTHYTGGPTKTVACPWIETLIWNLETLIDINLHYGKQSKCHRRRSFVHRRLPFLFCLDCRAMTRLRWTSKVEARCGRLRWSSNAEARCARLRWTSRRRLRWSSKLWRRSSKRRLRWSSRRRLRWSSECWRWSEYKCWR